MRQDLFALRQAALGTLNQQEKVLMDRLRESVRETTRLPPDNLPALQDELQQIVQTSPNLSGVLWHEINHAGRWFSPQFMADALALCILQSTPPWPTESVLEAAAMLSARALPLFLAQIDARFSPTVQAAGAPLEALARADQDAQDDAEGADLSWLKGWKLRREFGAYRHSLSHLPEVPPIHPAGRAALLQALLNHGPSDHQSYLAWSARTTALQHALTPLLRGPLSGPELAQVLETLLARQTLPVAYDQDSQPDALLALAFRAHGEGTLAPHALATLRRLWTSGYRSNLPELKAIQDWLTPELNPGEAWADAFLARLDALTPAQRRPWPALLAHTRSAKAGKPTAKWLQQAGPHLAAVGPERLREVLSAALPLLSRARTYPLELQEHGSNPNLLFDEFNALSLKGLLWLVPLVADDTLTGSLGGVIETALKKVAGIGPRATKIANAAVYALSQIESGAALSILARLSTTVTFGGTLKEIQKALDAVAARLNITPEELLELGVPTLGLSLGDGSKVAERLEQLGDVTARLSLGAGGAKLDWSRAGKPLKSVPAAIKREHAETLTELKAAQKEADKAVSALSARLDGQMIHNRTWTGEAWLARYLEHPLAGTLARRLIWVVDGMGAAYADGMMRTVTGLPVLVMEDSQVSLWHPLGVKVKEVLAWRERLETLEIVQPFKQAWREVYLLTDAERRTDTYSNRFAAHILKQHQFHALAALRGWRNRLRLMVDDSYPPATRELPAYALRTEFWIEGIGDDYGSDTTESGSYLRLRTDQVRFYAHGALENHAHAGGGGYEMWVHQDARPVAPLPLDSIPPRVLSEIMRDVDLFVGVASVGNDPTWQDGGPQGRFREYWQSYSFGELGETAQTRRAYLERLIPRLKISERLSLEDRFLRVQGDRRAYRIHLGSSNIQMEPNNQYLCIVPGQLGGAGPDLSFDGDRVLSVILSKAFLLADDTRITDTVILNQLR